MRKLLFPLLAGGLAFAASAPAAAGHRAAAPHRIHKSDNSATVLNLRMQSIELQIDILRDRGMIGREEARELQQQSRMLERRLYGLSPREVEDVEMGIDRLEDRVRLARDDGRIGGHLFDRGDNRRFDDGDRYANDEDRYHRDDYRRADPRGDPFARLEQIRRRDEHRQ